MKDQIKASLHSTFASILQDQRFKPLEDKVLKNTKRPTPTAAQRFLIMYYLKGIDPITLNDSVSQNTKDEEIAAILQIDPDNAKNFLSELSKKSKPLLHTKSNYEFLASFFIRPGQETILEEVEKILNTIQNKE